MPAESPRPWAFSFYPSRTGLLPYGLMPLHHSSEKAAVTDHHQVRPITVHSARVLAHEASKVSSGTRAESAEHHHLKASNSARRRTVLEISPIDLLVPIYLGEYQPYRVAPDVAATAGTSASGSEVRTCSSQHPNQNLPSTSPQP